MSETIVKPWQGICSSRCWNATTKRCRCKCKGAHHGEGMGVVGFSTKKEKDVESDD